MDSDIARSVRRSRAVRSVLWGAGLLILGGLATTAFGAVPATTVSSTTVVASHTSKGLAALNATDAQGLSQEDLAGLYTTAINEFIEALKDSPKDYSALMGKGRLHLKTGEAEDALAEFVKAVAVRRDAGTLQWLAVASLHAGRLDDALLYAREILTLNARSTVARDTLASVAFRRKDWRGAIAEWEKVFPHSPDPHMILTNIASAQEGLGEYDRALESIRRSIAINSRYASAYFERGVIYQKMGRFKEAKAALMRAVELAPAADNFREGLREVEDMERSSKSDGERP